MDRLKNKVAVVYGNGNIGTAVSHAFAEEGAKVYLSGRSNEILKKIANEIIKNGGRIEIAEVDARDEDEVNSHLQKIVSAEGKIDISFNTIGIPQKGIQGTALIDLSVENFMLPINVYAEAHFITARAGARYMVEQGQGVVLMHTPNASRISPPYVGGMVPAWSAIEALCRSLSVECGPSGVRSVCLLTTGIPETSLIDEVWEIHGKAHGITFEQFHSVMEGDTHRKRLTTLREFTNAAVFAASDDGSAISGTIFNFTSGMIVN